MGQIDIFPTPARSRADRADDPQFRTCALNAWKTPRRRPTMPAHVIGDGGHDPTSKSAWPSSKTAGDADRKAGDTLDRGPYPAALRFRAKCLSPGEGSAASQHVENAYPSRNDPKTASTSVVSVGAHSRLRIERHAAQKWRMPSLSKIREKMAGLRHRKTISRQINEFCV
jgi:hypothetical protein